MLGYNALIPTANQMPPKRDIKLAPMARPAFAGSGEPSLGVRFAMQSLRMYVASASTEMPSNALAFGIRAS